MTTHTPSIDRDPRVLQPSRVIVGHCERCHLVVVVTNQGETWPLIACRCGHVFATTAIANRARYESQGRMDLPLGEDDGA